MNLHRYKILIGESLWIIFGQVILVLGMLAGVRIMTGLLQPSEYGALALGMTVATLITLILFGPLSNGITRYYAPAYEKKEISGFITASKRLVMSAIVIVILLISILLICLRVIGHSSWGGLLVASLVFAIFRGSNSILNGVQNAARQRSIVAFHQGLEPWARFLLSALVIKKLGDNSTNAMIGYILGAGIILISQYYYFNKKISTNVSDDNNYKKWQTDILHYSWPFVTWGGILWMQQASDRWALQFFETTNEVGLYAVLFQMGYFPMSVVTGLLVQFITPILYQRAGDASDANRNKYVSKLILRLTIVVLLGTLIVSIIGRYFHQIIFTLFVDSKYFTISYLLPYVFLYGGIFAAGQMLSIDLQSKMKTKSMISVKIVTAIIGIAANFTGAYFSGIKGVVFAGVIFSVVHFIWMCIIFINDNYSRKIV